MSIGNFVAVNAYVSSMFAPLAFLGYIYQGIIQGEQTYITTYCTYKHDIVHSVEKANVTMLIFFFFISFMIICRHG